MAVKWSVISKPIPTLCGCKVDCDLQTHPYYVAVKWIVISKPIPTVCGCKVECDLQTQGLAQHTGNADSAV